MTPFDALRWVNSFARLPDSFHQRVAPTPLPDPYMVAWNPDVGDLLGLPRDAGTDPALVAAINGTALPEGAEPLAAIYAGHQFGTWVPQLGDGRAILLGEVETPRHARWEVQLKGAGPTRFSRMSDGRAVLRSTIREYLASEAMHGLGIPTTRALAIIGSDAPVQRERTETAAILVRVAPTHVRFGTFELFASRRLTAEVRLLADYVIEHDYPHLLALAEGERHAAWYAEVVARTARLMAQWTAVGFAHGVMNTDNFSITGHTIDYGPYGWLDRYDPAHICNHSDHGGRYAFSQQPAVGLWNCNRLGEALHGVVDEAAALNTLRGYRTIFETTMTELLRAKLGLSTADPSDAELATDWLALLHDGGADYTRSFRALSHYDTGSAKSSDALRAELTDGGALEAWLARYDARLGTETRSATERHRAMLGTNPKFVLRNWVAQDAIVNAEARNFDRIREVWGVLRKPYDEHPEYEHLAASPPEWATGLEVSCSS